MPERKGWYLKGPTKPRVPNVVFTIVPGCSFHPVASSPATTIRRFEYVALTFSHRRRGKWSPVESEVVRTRQEAWNWLNRRAIPGKTNWCVAPIATDALTLLEFWSHASLSSPRGRSSEEHPRRARTADCDDRSCVLEKFIPRGNPDIVVYRRNGVRWFWVSGEQYVPGGCSPESVPARNREHDTEGVPEAAEGLAERTRRTAEAWGKEFRELIDWWAINAKAPWGATLGQLAVSMLRTHCPPRVLCTHSDSDVHYLEREAAYGGRASCWYVGQVGSFTGSADTSHVGRSDQRHELNGRNLTQVDVVSMYPTLLRDQVYPVKLIRHTTNARPTDPQELAVDAGVIARVLIRTKAAEYPCRRRNRVLYPTGQFWTTLTGPELLALRQDGEILKCSSMVTYQLSRPFAAAADALISSRIAARGAVGSSASSILKRLSNSLGGKLAQRQGSWERRADLDGYPEWGEWCKTTASGSRTEWFRSFAGACWGWNPDKTGRGPFTFAFAYLAAYGRLLMRRIREACPPQSVVSQDTDGLWVLPDGLAALENPGLNTGTDPGQLRVVGSAKTGRWFGPRHYCTDGTWTLSGFDYHKIDTANGLIWDTVEDTMWNQCPRSAPNFTSYTTRSTKLAFDIDGGSVGPDGWVIPRYIQPRKLDDK